MSKEKQCKCCKEYWWEMNIHSQNGLCPNCYDYVADLEAKLAELKEKVSRFKVGQECYFINRNFYYSDYAEDFTEEFFIDCSKIQKQQNYYYIKDAGVYPEEDLFATEQEAQEKLKEIQGNE